MYKETYSAFSGLKESEIDTKISIASQAFGQYKALEGDFDELEDLVKQFKTKINDVKSEFEYGYKSSASTVRKSIIDNIVSILSTIEDLQKKIEEMAGKASSRYIYFYAIYSTGTSVKSDVEHEYQSVEGSKVFGFIGGKLGELKDVTKTNKVNEKRNKLRYSISTEGYVSCE